MKLTIRPVALLSFLLVACSASPAGRAPAGAAGAHELEPLLSVRDGRTGERLSFEVLLDVLAARDAVFLGETHIDETTHMVELAVYEGLLARRSGKLVLALEMFERDVQAALDAYVRGEIDEPTFLSRSRPWGNYATAYRPLIEAAKAGRHAVVASNFPAPLRRKLSGENPGFDSLSAEERAFAPAELRANTPAYWRRVDNAVRGHQGMMGAKPAADDPRLFSTQSLWDNSMGEACALALARNPGAAVLHVNGGFHSEYWDGTARQLRLRRPDARLATVAIVPVTSPASAELGGLPQADYVVLAEKRAQDLDEGTYSVFVARQHEYRLYVPPAATSSARVPLLLWLPDDGELATDALALWKKRLGETCAIAVLEAPYRETQEDLVEGGRWFWPDSFREDVGALAEAVERVFGYALRNLPVDPARVVLAGEGTGATVVSVATLLDDGLAVHGLALAPRRYSDIKDLPLPLPELRGDVPPARKSLAVHVQAADEAWWSSEIAEYRGVGLESSLALLGTDAWSAEIERENLVRAGLGLPAIDLGADAPRLHVVVQGPRARAWARPLAAERARQGERVALLEATPAEGVSTAIDLDVRAADYAEKLRLPRAPGPFGGTTVLVLPDGIAGEEALAWKELQEKDPLARTSQFHRFVLATESGERALPVVLAELAAKKRKNVLVVPALWCADGGRMRALQRSARAFEDTMTLHWRPGLGG